MPGIHGLRIQRGGGIIAVDVVLGPGGRGGLALAAGVHVPAGNQRLGVFRVIGIVAYASACIAVHVPKHNVFNPLGRTVGLDGADDSALLRAGLFPVTVPDRIIHRCSPGLHTGGIINSCQRGFVHSGHIAVCILPCARNHRCEHTVPVPAFHGGQHVG